MTSPSGLPLKALQFWGATQGAVANRGSTADVWAAINAAAAANGMASPDLSLGDFNRLRSMAAGVRNSSEAFGRGQIGSAITSDMIGTPPWARPLGEQNALQMTQVTFLHTTTDGAGNLFNDYRSVMFTGPLPATKAELLDQLNEDSQALADKYDSAHVAIDNIALLGV